MLDKKKKGGGGHGKRAHTYLHFELIGYHKTLTWAVRERVAVDFGALLAHADATSVFRLRIRARSTARLDGDATRCGTLGPG